MSNIADIHDALSDFNSCQESFGEQSSSSDADVGSSDEDAGALEKRNGFLTANEKKRLKKFKRKLALTPGKEQFLKKPNTQVSPK